MPVTIPCGNCIGCRLEKSRQWAVRAVQEASMHEENSFITLTFDDKHIPVNRSIQKTYIQRFLKKLRKKLKEKYDKEIKYLLCGEYGENFDRPHYHACIFGHAFNDRFETIMRNGDVIIQSYDLADVWKNGFNYVGDLTFESAAYVARYVTKKITGEQAKEHYGEREPEFALMSRNPGLGRKWYEKYKDDILNVDSVIIRNDLQVRPPKYYDSIMKIDDLPRYQKIKNNRKGKMNLEEHTRERLDVKEHLMKKRFKKLKRSIENGERSLFVEG